MIRFMTVVVCLALASTGLAAADKELDRLEEAGVVIEEILAIDDNIPQDLVGLRAEILSYSRSRGLFAGVSLEGASVRPDNDASTQVYGRRMTAHTIVTGTDIPVPAAGRRFVDALEKNAPRNASQKATN